MKLAESIPPGLKPALMCWRYAWVESPAYRRVNNAARVGRPEAEAHRGVFRFRPLGLGVLRWNSIWYSQFFLRNFARFPLSQGDSVIVVLPALL